MSTEKEVLVRQQPTSTAVHEVNNNDALNNNMANNDDTANNNDALNNDTANNIAPNNNNAVSNEDAEDLGSVGKRKIQTKEGKLEQLM